MASVTIHKAKTELSKLIARVEAGEEIIIARGDVPVAKLIAIAGPAVQRAPGKWKGRISLPDPPFAALSEEELADWEGAYETPF